jgi:hypothetical protein
MPLCGAVGSTESLAKWFSFPRLETRTKEFNICASTGDGNPPCAMKVTVAGFLQLLWVAQSAGPNPPGDWSECEHTC